MALVYVAAILALAALLVHFDNANASACGKLTRCAVRKCFTSEKVHRAIYNSTADDMFSTILNQFSFLCIASKCRSDCRNCEQCQYALSQIKNLASGSHTEMQCPKMEQCSEQCMRADLQRAIPCVKKRCNVHCFDGDCPQCASVAKRVFLFMCREHNVPNLPLVSYNGSCMALFDVVVQNYIALRTNITQTR
ncbi:Protein dct-5 [Toxocara canis]|nr:Protein dct-5 [Toxocara canis]